MKTKLALIVMVFGFLLSMNVQAGSNDQIFRSMDTEIRQQNKGNSDNGNRGRGGDDRRGGGMKAPEISADSAAIGLALVSGVLLLAAERSRTRRA